MMKRKEINQIYEINKEKNELNFQIRNKEIDILRKKDEFENIKK